MQNVRAILIPGALLLLLPLLSACSKAPLTDAEMKQKSLEVFQTMQKQLGKKLQSTIKSQGVSAAIKVCKQVSPRVELELSRAPAFIVRRISLKNRNPGHKPDKFEKTVLLKWQADLAAGKSLSPVTERTKTEYRVLKPILIKKGVCLNCHGMDKDIQPAVLKKIQELYPADLARGYKMGQLRGAFSAQWNLTPQ